MIYMCTTLKNVHSSHNIFNIKNKHLFYKEIFLMKKKKSVTTIQKRVTKM